MKSRLIRSGLAVVTLLVASISAQAQSNDGYQDSAYKAPRYKAPAYTSPAFSWTGFYVGLIAGYGFGTSDWTSPAVSNSPSGALVGGTIGYNFQTGSWVWGIEGDMAWSGMKDEVTCGGGTCETSNSWLGTARARIGYAGWSNFLPYFTGGAAFGGVKATNSTRSSASDTLMGWTLGAGLEYAMWSKWTVKLEYLYVDLGSLDCGTPCSATIPNEVSFNSNIVRAGVNYRF